MRMENLNAAKIYLLGIILTNYKYIYRSFIVRKELYKNSPKLAKMRVFSDLRLQIYMGLSFIFDAVQVRTSNNVTDVTLRLTSNFYHKWQS